MKRRTILALSACAAAMATSPAVATQIPPNFLNCVVALGGQVIDFPDGKTASQKWATVGTGFFYGFLIKDDAEVKNRRYAVYLVTAKHVLDDWKKMRAQGIALSEMQVRVNPGSLESKATEFDLISGVTDQGTSWTAHPEGKDIAVIPINMSMLREKSYGADFFESDNVSATKARLKEAHVSAGDFVFTLGFPMGLSGEQRTYVIVRQGIIARIDEMIDDASDTFMIDSLVFPGNSGGPVVLKPELSSIMGTSNQPKALLIGVVQAYRPYIDVAISQQTQHPRISFEENSGLAIVLPIDYVDDAIKANRLPRK